MGTLIGGEREVPCQLLNYLNYMRLLSVGSGGGALNGLILIVGG